MNRWLMAAVIGLMAMGCAVGVEDPDPPPAPEPDRKEPVQPAQPFSEELGQDNSIGVLQRSGAERQLPPLPLDMPEVPTPPQPGQ